MKWLTVFLVILVSLPQWSMAEIYRSVDEQGNVQYSDVPQKDAQKIDLPPMQIYTTPADTPQSSAITSTTNQATSQVKKAATPDYQISINSPINKATVRNNNGIVVVSVGVNPIPQQGETVRVLLDGKPVKKPDEVTDPNNDGTFMRQTSSNTVTLENVYRGTHHVTAELLDSQGQVLTTSQAVIFYMHRAHISGAGKISD